MTANVSKKRVAEEIASQPHPKRPKLQDKTDVSRWRCKNDDGVQTWVYLDDEEAAKEWPQTCADKWFLGLSTGLPDLPTAKTPLNSVLNGLYFFEKLQMEPGNWGCEYGGPMFLMPGIVITWYVTKTPIPDAWATEMKNYVLARANPDDGGWGLHIEGDSTVFGTVLNYVVLRILGLDADHAAMVKARGTLHKLGGATHAPHWAKFWLAVLGVSEWDMVNPVPSELWLLPDWVPIAPWRWWVHMRQVFLPLSFIYARRWSFEGTPLTRALRDEVFTQPWESIEWEAHRNSINEMENYHPKTWLLNAANWFLVKVWQPYLRPQVIADRAEAWVSELVDMEDRNTGYACLAPVNAPMNTLVTYIRDGPSAWTFRRHIERLPEYLWVKDEGMLVNGTNGVQNWDTAFLVQAVVAAGFASDERWRPMLTRALGYLDRQQIRENCGDQEKCYRSPRKGAWTFSNRDQGYPVSDCVAECLKAVILLQKMDGGKIYPQLLDDQRIFDAVDTILTYQNSTGGVASYEPRRGEASYMEMLNAAEVFGRIMVDYDYPECTTACVTALALFRSHWPDYRASDVDVFIKRAVEWIKTDQRPEGSWYGSWGICFTYATMFAMESLAHMGETYANSEHARRGCEFLLSKQRPDGGWSECYKACEKMEYIEHPSGSLVVQTAWAVLGLLEGEYPDPEPMRRGVRLLMDRQQANGEWLQEAIEGVFNKSAMISYPNYKFQFPIKAMGMFARRFRQEAGEMGL